MDTYTHIDEEMRNETTDAFDEMLGGGESGPVVSPDSEVALSVALPKASRIQ